jgi:hypothetical protein
VVARRRLSLDYFAFGVVPGLTYGVLLRRSCAHLAEVAYYLTYAPAGTAPRPGPAGRSETPPSGRRGRPGSTSTRSAPGTAGIVTSPSPCSPWRRWPSAPKRERRQATWHRPLAGPEVHSLLLHLVWTAAHPADQFLVWSCRRCGDLATAYQYYRECRLDRLRQKREL